ncbi:oxygen-independent coproporphyrinogen III oxidase [uncultured Paraglaciecola sp.]|uniref:oxygen-independent coproporphyrinogen III oxidase n=1 Tax=uncultured Paraglaciecola sp. TaxID=1765024 RepID=UPI0025E2AAF8|nr:oxygen-independent coproporphyrinogen III oxidase [uncultured Paraglaciecola sp.]
MKTVNFFEQKLLNKYDTSGPRYTSYPTALEFSDNFSNDELIRAGQSSSTKELSLYLHIPFCHSLCYYCGCNKIVTRHTAKADIYLDNLEKEILSRAQTFGTRSIRQLHLGGGTPSFLSHAQLSRLIANLRNNFSFAKDIEMSIEVDPREIELELADHLASIGFNRLSIGVQDTNQKVQKAINRPQSTEFIQSLIKRAKLVGFTSVNIDLIYGLPHQTKETFSQTLDDVINKLNADRISLFSYAHMPKVFAAQRKIRDEWMPSTDDKFALMKLAIETLSANGYEFIGMDHFAKPTDELAKAQQNAELHRNFQGYTTKGDCDLLGLGVSAISSVDDVYSQNVKTLKDYYQQIDNQGHAVVKGRRLSQDDKIRRLVINQLMCNLYLDKKSVEQEFKINFEQYFADDIRSLSPFINDGLLKNTAENINVSPRARLLIRNICMSFDAYLKNHLNQQRFSRVI